MSRTRAYCFTINNPLTADEEQVTLLKDIAGYLIVGRETGENGTEHLQGYIYCKEAITFSSLKKKITRAHIEVSKGSPMDNSVYCQKDGNIFIEFGKLPKQGARTDIQRTVETLKEGANMRAISNSANNYQCIKMAEVWLKYNEEPRDWKPEVRWYHGPTGVGKTKSAREWLGDDIYTCLDSIKWFEGYDSHENVLIDDFRKDFCKFHQLLKLLDRYEYKVETKGGSRQFVAKKIAITSPYPPQYVYEIREDVNQLVRRIDSIIQIGNQSCELEEQVDLLELKSQCILNANS